MTAYTSTKALSAAQVLTRSWSVVLTTNRLNTNHLKTNGLPSAVYSNRNRNQSLTTTDLPSLTFHRVKGIPNHVNYSRRCRSYSTQSSKPLRPAYQATGH